MALRRENTVDVITQRGRIVGMWEGGMPTSHIATQTGLSVRTVQRWIKRWQDEESLLNKPKSGRKRVTTPEEDARILNTVANRSQISAVRVTRELHLNCHPRQQGDVCRREVSTVTSQ